MVCVWKLNFVLNHEENCAHYNAKYVVIILCDRIAVESVLDDQMTWEFVRNGISC